MKDQEKKRVGKPRHGKEVKGKYSVSIEDRFRQEVIKEYGNFSHGITEIVKQWIKNRGE